MSTNAIVKQSRLVHQNLMAAGRNEHNFRPVTGGHEALALADRLNGITALPKTGRVPSCFECCGSIGSWSNALRSAVALWGEKQLTSVQALRFDEVSVQRALPAA
jgi:hypothetical protein